MMLETMPGFQVVGETNGKGNPEIQVKHLIPNLIFIDVHLKGNNCYKLTTEIHKLFPESRIILMSMFAEKSYVEDGTAAGASAVLFKPSIVDNLEMVVRSYFPEEFELRANQMQ